MQGQDFTKLIEASKHVAKELKNYHPHMTVVITSEYIRVDESIIGVPIDARSDKSCPGTIRILNHLLSR